MGKNIVSRKHYLIGIDEVGRGSLAGPVVVAAAAFPRSLRFPIKEKRSQLRDSKQLTARSRKIWSEYLKKHPQVSYAVASIGPRLVDRLNVSDAANVAALRVWKKVISQISVSGASVTVLLDGGLYLGNGSARRIASNVKTVIKADEKFAAVKAASAIAKVYRDEQMIRLAKKYPIYGFEIHKGYGTLRHRRAIKKFGPCEIHRTTFL